MSQAPDVRLDGLYGDRILDHYRSPRNRQPLPDADLSAGEFNPFCGDRVDLSLTLGPGTRIVQTSAASEGCSIIQASASMLSCLLEGKTLEGGGVAGGRLPDHDGGEAATTRQPGAAG